MHVLCMCFHQAALCEVYNDLVLKMHMKILQVPQATTSGTIHALLLVTSTTDQHHCT